MSSQNFILLHRNLIMLTPPPLQYATIDSDLPITQTADTVEEVTFESLVGDVLDGVIEDSDVLTPHMANEPPESSEDDMSITQYTPNKYKKIKTNTTNNNESSSSDDDGSVDNTNIITVDRNSPMVIHNNRTLSLSSLAYANTSNSLEDQKYLKSCEEYYKEKNHYKKVLLSMCMGLDIEG